MPKHLPTFKHLLSSSSNPPRPAEKPDRSVNQLIAASRSSDLQAASLRDVPPHPIPSGSQSRSSGTPSVWIPGEGDTSVLVACGLRGDAPVHPAELARRSELLRRQASRSVAGPVPPPSWRANATASSSKSEVMNSPSTQPSEAVTKGDLIAARAMLSCTTGQSASEDYPGPARLVEYCLNAVLLHLESAETISEGISSAGGDEEKYEEMTVGKAMQEQVGYLEPHLKIALFDIASIRQTAVSRLSDRSIRAILHRPEDIDHDTSNHQSTNDSNDWSETPTIPPDIHYLPIIIHPNPLPLLRQLPSFPSLSLTSLNLAHSTIKDLEKLIIGLPVSLRELSLVGIRFGGHKEEDVWRRGLGLLGRKLIVLRTLDLSFPSTPISAKALIAMVQPENSRLPSLSKFGFRGIFPFGEIGATWGEYHAHRVILARLQSSERKRWVDIVYNLDFV